MLDFTLSSLDGLKSVADMLLETSTAIKISMLEAVETFFSVPHWGLASPINKKAMPLMKIIRWKKFNV